MKDFFTGDSEQSSSSEKLQILFEDEKSILDLGKEIVSGNVGYVKVELEIVDVEDVTKVDRKVALDVVITGNVMIGAGLVKTILGDVDVARLLPNEVVGGVAVVEIGSVEFLRLLFIKDGVVDVVEIEAGGVEVVVIVADGEIEVDATFILFQGNSLSDGMYLLKGN